jgi:hypothetical protein
MTVIADGQDDNIPPVILNEVKDLRTDEPVQGSNREGYYTAITKAAYDKRAFLTWGASPKA